MLSCWCPIVLFLVFMFAHAFVSLFNENISGWNQYWIVSNCAYCVGEADIQLISPDTA